MNKLGIYDGDLIKKSLIFEDALSNTHKDAWFTLYKDKPPKAVFQGFDHKSYPILNTCEFDVTTRGGIHHQLRPPEHLNNQQGFQHELLLETCQVVSFLASNVENFDNYYFDYGGLGNKTCIWIDHGPHELPQLLVLHDSFPDFENWVINIFSKYKDKNAKLRTLTQSLILLNILRSHATSGVYISLVCVIPSGFLYIVRLDFSWTIWFRRVV